MTQFFTLTNREIFFHIYKAPTEENLQIFIDSQPSIFEQNNWHPINGDENNYGVIENQQASPIPAIIEKITNSIDAILMKECYLRNINPKSTEAPHSMEEAIKVFFPNSKQWDLPTFRKKQSEDIQIIADGPRFETSLIIYDNGEGQKPDDFESTLLSLLRGNKNEIRFVQGKYNMGGSGALVFCGKRRYQLIASKRFNGEGDFGFTLVRQHPFTKEEQLHKKNTWYEFLRIDNKIPSFEIDTLDLGLHNRKYKTGTILKLYSYDLPSGSRSVISRDLNQSINEFLFEPALPIITIDKKERYPDDRNLERDLYGLKRRLEENKNKYIQDYFLESYDDNEIEQLKITCYVFKSRIEGKTAKETKDTIGREFFKNNMSVLFSLNGQVHGHFTSEFITRTLKMPLLKDYLLIHVDCTKLKYDFRKELFMASRDRLKHGEETAFLREKVADILIKSNLSDIYKRRKDGLSFTGEDKNELLKSFTKNLPLKSDILKLLSKTFKLDEIDKKEKKETKVKEEKNKEEPFHPKRYPSYFKLNKQDEIGEIKVIAIPRNGAKKIKFFTDVENEYFVRVEEPGDLKIGVLNYKTNNTEGGDKPGEPKNIEELFNVQKSNPQDGCIKIGLAPNKELSVGDNIQIKVTLTNPCGDDFEKIITIKISEPEQPKEQVKKKEEEDNSNIGLPELVLVYKEKNEEIKRTTWEDLESQGIDMQHENIVYPNIDKDLIQQIYINMDSKVLKDYKSSLKTEEQFELAEKRYYSSIYFHTLFLFTISKNKKYSMRIEEGEVIKDIDLTDYIKDLFESYYAQFLLNFGMSELVQSLEN